MDSNTIISLSAVTVSFVSFFFTYAYNRRITKENSRYQEALFHLERNLAFEGKVADWPEAFDFYGIDIEAAQKEGITLNHMAYLINALNSQASVAMAKGISVYDHIKQSGYRQNMYSHEITRKTWKYVKDMFSDRGTKIHVDKYLEETFSDDTN